MELDFDKEIDTLLRKARHDGPVLVGDVVSPHLNADEISAFAENAMPENSRALYTAHLADCDRCRKILSNVLVMNTEAVPAAASSNVIGIAESAVPWYRRLFMFPNLAYLMGSLVLVFSGFLAFSVIQKSQMGDSAVVSQISEQESTQGGPNFQAEPSYGEGYGTASNMTANAASNMALPNGGRIATNANTSIAAPLPGERGPLAESALRDDRDVSLDGADVTTVPIPPPAAEAAPRVVRDRDELAKTKTEDKVGSSILKDSAKNEPMMKQYPGTLNQTAPSQSGPMRNNENQYRRQLENMDQKAATKRKSKEDEESSSGRRVVAGRTFERKQGVWYDAAYQSRPTINVRRGSAEFSRLDGGLRSIANSLSGTIVVVWGAKAYRIQ